MAEQVPPDEEPASSPLTPEQRVERRRQRLLASVSAARTRTIQEKVAWILNRDPRARDSDIHLLLEYWKEFHPKQYGGGPITPELMYRLTRQMTVTRARATIQNTFRLFQASAEVQAARRTLSEETRIRMAEELPAAPLITVAGDETGKNEEFLIVGSVWALTAEQLRQTMFATHAFKKGRNIKGELHFVNINARKLPDLLAFVDEVIRPAPALSFRAVSTRRAGLDVDRALAQLFTQMLLLGIEHEHTTGRAPLPRSIGFWKDLENRAQDKLLLADVTERLKDASAARYNGGLRLEEFAAIASHGSELIQIADLFVSSVNRVVNQGANGTHPKDVFARYFLEAVNMPTGPRQESQVGDMTVYVAI